MCCNVSQCVAVCGALLRIRSCTQTFFSLLETAVFPHYHSQTWCNACMFHFLDFLWVVGTSSTLFKSWCFLVLLCIKPSPFDAPSLQYSRWECNAVSRRVRMCINATLSGSLVHILAFSTPISLFPPKTFLQALMRHKRRRLLLFNLAHLHSLDRECIWIYVYVNMYIYIYAYYMRMYVDICMNIHICTYIQIYVYI